MTEVYLVERVGIYSQRIYGVFDSMEKAIEGAHKAKEDGYREDYFVCEKDDYYSFFIRPIVINNYGYSNGANDIEIFKGTGNPYGKGEWHEPKT